MSRDPWIECDDKHFIRARDIDVVQEVDSYKGKMVRLRVDGHWYQRSQTTINDLLYEEELIRKRERAGND